MVPTPQPNLRCVLVDDHEMLLDLLVSAVETIPGVTVVATGTDVVDAERLAELERVDLLVVDRRLKTGGGVDVVRRMLVRHPALKSILIAGTTADFVCPADLLDVVVSVIDKAHASEALLAEIVRVGNLSRTGGGRANAVLRDQGPADGSGVADLHRPRRRSFQQGSRESVRHLHADRGDAPEGDREKTRPQRLGARAAGRAGAARWGEFPAAKGPSPEHLRAG